ASAEGELELADSPGFDGELGASDARRIDRHGLICRIIDEGKPILGLELEVHAAVRAGIVVDSDWKGYAIALCQRDGKIEIHEEILKDLNAGIGAAESPFRCGGKHGHPPRGDGIG